MTDFVTIPATGTTGTATPDIATDNVGGIHFQYVKLDLGTTGVSSKVSGTVPVSAASLPLPSGAATEATLAIQTNRPATATITSVTAATSGVTLLASNTARRQALIYNDSGSAVFIAFAVSAATSAYTLRLGSSGYYELFQPVYTGTLSALWVSATGAARVTEITT